MFSYLQHDLRYIHHCVLVDPDHYHCCCHSHHYPFTVGLFVMLLSVFQIVMGGGRACQAERCSSPAFIYILICACGVLSFAVS